MSVLHHCKSAVMQVSDFVLLWHCNNFNADVGYVQHDIVSIVSNPWKFGSYSANGQYETDGSYARAWLAEITLGANVGGQPVVLSGDFTYDFWAYPIADNIAFGLILQGLPATFIRKNASTAGTCTWRIGYSVAKYGYGDKVINWPLNTWGHVAVIRDGDNHYILCNGKLVYYLNDNTWASAEGGIYICGEDNLVTKNSKYVDEVALRLGAAWDCSGAAVGDQVFAVPIAPYEA